MKKHSLKEWIMATRPWSFPASSMPVLVTLFYLYWIDCNVNWYIGIWAIINIMAFHAAGNTWSDYKDYKKGVDRDDTIGGISITSGQFKAEEIKHLAFIILAASTLSGIMLVICTGLPTLYIGIAGFLLTIIYPWTKYHALGDLNIFLTYSLLPILGTSFVSTEKIYPEALWISIPIGLITVGILHSNNIRDTEHDKRAGINTFAMLTGGNIASYIYCFEVLFPFLWIMICIAIGVLPTWSILVLLALKPAINNTRKALKYKQDGAKTFIGIDEKTAQLQLVFSLLLTISLIIAKYIHL